jgi:hypothetical protein
VKQLRRNSPVCAEEKQNFLAEAKEVEARTKLVEYQAAKAKHEAEYEELTLRVKLDEQCT